MRKLRSNLRMAWLRLRQKVENGIETAFTPYIDQKSPENLQGSKGKMV